MADALQPVPNSTSKNGTPLAMGNVLNRLVLLVLSRCSVCKLPKGKRHLVSDHDWIRDGSIPEWRGWHAFRRGVATNCSILVRTWSRRKVRFVTLTRVSR